MALTKFLNAPINTVTRERVFFHKLYFDLKLAAARAGYPLSIFEPEVDRDKFDILLDDGDNERRVQLKTFTLSSGTSQWKSNKRFMRPDIQTGARLGIPPADCGVGGGCIAIEIDDANDDAPVSYFYTDRFVVGSFASGLLGEFGSQQPRGKGRPPSERRKLAREFLADLAVGEPKDAVDLPKRLFVRLRSPDAVLAIASLHSVESCYLPSNHVLDAEVIRFVADDSGVSEDGLDETVVATVHARMQDILALIDDPTLMTFSRRVT